MAKETQDLLSFAAGDKVQLDIADAIAEETQAARVRIVRAKLEREAAKRGLNLSKVDII